MAVQIPTRPPNRPPAVDPLDPDQIIADLERTGRIDSLGLRNVRKGLASGAMSPESARLFLEQTRESRLLPRARPVRPHITDEQAAIPVPLREGGTDRRAPSDRKREANRFIDIMNRPPPRDRQQLIAQVDAVANRRLGELFPDPTVMGPAQRAVARAVDRSGFKLPRPDARLPEQPLRPVSAPAGIPVAVARERATAAVDEQNRRLNLARKRYEGLFPTSDPAATTINDADTPEAASLKAQALLAGHDSGTLAATEAMIEAIRRDDEVPGFLASAGLAIHRSNLQIAEAGGTVLRFLGGVVGLDAVAELGEDIEAYMGPRQELFTAALNFGDGNVLDNPEILLDARRLFAEVAGFIPQLVGGGLVGGAVKVGVSRLLTRHLVRKGGRKGAVGAAAEDAPSRFLKVGDRVLDLTDKTTQFKMIRLGKAMTAGGHIDFIKKVATVAGALGFGGFAGVLEGSSTYREIFDTLVAQGAPPKVAREAAEMAFMQMTAASGLLNAFAINKILAPLNGGGRAKNAVRRLTRGFWEAATEYLEEPAEVLIKFGQDAITVEQAVQQLRDGTNVLLPAFTIGMLLPGAGGDFITAGAFRAGATPDDVDVGTAESASNQIDEETGELPDEISPGPAGKAVSTLTDEEVGNAQAEQEDVDAATTQVEEGEVAPAATEVADENATDAVKERLAKQGEDEAAEALDPGEDFAEPDLAELQAELVQLTEDREVTDDEIGLGAIDGRIEEIEQELADAQAVRDTEEQVQEAGAVTEGGGRQGGEDIQQPTGRTEQATETDREGEQPRADVTETTGQQEEVTLAARLQDDAVAVTKADIPKSATKADLMNTAREAGIEINARDTRGIMINKLIKGQAKPVVLSSDRAAPPRVAFDKTERAGIDKVAATLSPEEAPRVEELARKDRQKFPPSEGWQRTEVVGVQRNKIGKIVATIVRKIAPSFHRDPKTGKAYPQGEANQKRQKRRQTQLAKKLVTGFRAVEAEARRGGKRAKEILAQRTWYTAVTRRLRGEFGGAADIIADLMGATSPQQNVQENFNQTIDAVRQLSQGKFDTEMEAFHQFLNEGNNPNDYDGPTITKINGNKYGTNTIGTMLALAKVWRAMPPGTAPKARNFTGNLIGISDLATIDIWAARLMQRLAFNNKNRIPTKAEKGVGGTVLVDGTRVGGSFGFAQGVFDIAAAELGMTPKDLQAVAWFMEKRVWTENKWSFAEGGSVDAQLDIASFDRLITGLSIARPGFKPTKRDQLKIGTRIRRVMTRLNAVSFRQASTIGSFLGDIERAFDIEATVGPDFDITALVNEMADIGQEHTQDDVFVSRVLRPGEENPNARPGIEVFFKNQQSMKDAMVLLNTMTESGIDGFTMVVDPRANPSTIEKGPNFIGVRVQFVPEFAARGDENFAKEFRANGIDGMLRQATLQFDSIAEQLYEAGAASVEFYQYDTLVFGKENYGEYTTRSDRGNDQAADRVWFSTPISVGVEAAIVRIEAGKSNRGADGVRRSSDETTNLGTDTRGAGVAPEGGGRISSPPVRNDGKVELTHWSRQENLAELDPAQHGTGIRGAEARRKANNEDLYVDRTYYGVGVGREGGYVKERALGNEQYTASVNPDKLYNWHSDPDGLIEAAKAEGHLGDTLTTRYEQLIKEAGYDGYWVTDPSFGMVAAVFNKLRTEVTPDANADPAQATAAAEEPGASQVFAAGNSEAGTVQPSLAETDSTPSAAQGATLRLSNPNATRPNDKDAKPGAKGLTADAVRFHILEHLQRLKGFVEIRVVQSVKDLPEVLQTGTTQFGVYYEQPGQGAPTVYLVADNITSAAHAETIILHEAVGHAGMRALPNFGDIVKSVQDLINAAIAAPGSDPFLMEVLKEVEARNTVHGDEALFAEEVIAHLASRSTTRGAAMKEIIAAFKQVLRNLGFTQTFTSTDVMGLIRASHTRMQARALALSGLGIDTASEEFQAVLKSKNLASLRAAQTDQEIGESLEALAVELTVTRAIDTAGMEPEIDEGWDESMNIPVRETPWQDRMKKAWNEFASNETMESLTQGLIDAANAIKLGEIAVYGKLLDASRSAYKAMSTLKNLSNVMGAVMREGIPEVRDGAFRHVKDRMSFGAMFEPLAKIRGKESQVRNLEKYLVAVRARRLIDEDIAAGRQGTKQAKEKRLEEQLVDRTIAWAQSQVAENGQTYAEIFDEVRANWQSLNSNNLDLAVQTGVIDKAERDIWEQYGDYVPFWRDASALEGRTAPGTGQGVSVESRGIHRLTGGVDREGNPLKLEGNVVESMFMNTAYLLDRSYRNEAMKRVAELGTNIKLGKMRKVAQKAKPAITVENDEVASLLWKAGIIDAKTLDDAIDEFNSMAADDKNRWTTFWTRIKPPGGDIVTVWNKGKPTYYEADPMWLRSIRGAQGSEVGSWITAFRTSKKWLTVGVTIDPAFMLANWMRDTLQTFVVSDAPMVPIADALRGLKDAYQGDEALLTIAFAGRSGGEFYDSHPDDIRKLIAGLGVPEAELGAFMKTVVSPQKMWRWWRRVGSASEFGNRVAVYKSLVKDREARVTALVSGSSMTEEAAREQALSEGFASDAEAAYQAQDLLNFTRSGDYAAIQALIQMIPFLNARIQGLNRLWRGARDNPFHFMTRGGGLALAGLALAIVNDDDERYRQLPEWDKDTYIHFWIGDEHFRIPKPFETGVIFLTVPERMVRLMRGIDGMTQFKQSMLHAITETFVFTPIPQLGKPLIESYMNRSFFTDSPIVTLNEENLNPEAQYDFRTGEFAKRVAQGMPESAPEWMRSPKRLEHLVRGYFGAMGMYAMSFGNVMTESAVYGPSKTMDELTSQELHELPVLKRFIQGKTPSTTKYNRLLWDMLKEADGLARTMKKYQNEQRFEDALGIRHTKRDILAIRPRLRKIANQVSKINVLLNQNEVSNRSPDARRRVRDTLNARKIRLTRQIAPFIDLF